MMRASVVLIGLTITLASGCASPPAPPRPTHGLVDAVGRLVVVASGQARFMVIEHRTERGRTFDEIVKWTPYSWLRPLIALVHEDINQIPVRGGRCAPSTRAGPSPPPSTRFVALLASSRTRKAQRDVVVAPVGFDPRCDLKGLRPGVLRRGLAGWLPPRLSSA
jgi:hypothetical protein